MASRGLRTLCLTYTDFAATAPGRPEDFFETSHDDNLVVNCIVGIKVRWRLALCPAKRRRWCGAILDRRPTTPAQGLLAGTSALDLVVEGLAAVQDPVRAEVPDAVRVCKRAGITVRMVTGDNTYTAQHIARECGILSEDGVALEGPDFRNRSDEELKELLPSVQVHFDFDALLPCRSCCYSRLAHVYQVSDPAHAARCRVSAKQTPPCCDNRCWRAAAQQTSSSWCTC